MEKKKVPPKSYKSRIRKKFPRSLSNRFRKMEIGDHIEIPRKQESQITMSARIAGITVTRRRMGSDKKTTVWRIEDEKSVNSSTEEESERD